MKIWIITPNTSHGGYDTYDSAIVAAKTEEEAKRIHPNPSKGFYDTGGVFHVSLDGTRHREICNYGTWVNNPDQVDAELIGTAKKGTESGVILASFNAG